MGTPEGGAPALLLEQGQGTRHCACALQRSNYRAEQILGTGEALQTQLQQFMADVGVQWEVGCVQDPAGRCWPLAPVFIPCKVGGKKPQHQLVHPVGWLGP